MGGVLPGQWGPAGAKDMMAKKKENAMIEVRDVVLWPQHVHGSPTLRERLLGLGPEAVVRLRVNGRITTWFRMKDG